MSYAGIWQFGPLVFLSKEAIKEMDHTNAGKKVQPLGASLQGGHTRSVTEMKASCCHGFGISAVHASWFGPHSSLGFEAILTLTAPPP